ncbi:hypothetical protein EJB05_44592, partial [Eragrostis curvula]
MVWLADSVSLTLHPAQTAPCYEPGAPRRRRLLAALPRLPPRRRRLLLPLRLPPRPPPPAPALRDPPPRLRPRLPPPRAAAPAAALLRRGGRPVPRRGGFEFGAICFTALDVGRLRAWVASFRDGECFHPFWFEQRCEHAAGSLYWHVCNHDSSLALDAATSVPRRRALLPRRFDFATLAGRHCTWVESFCNGLCRWRALVQIREVMFGLHPFWFEQYCVHAAGSLYWHVCNHDTALAVDMDTMLGVLLCACAGLDRVVTSGSCLDHR